MAEQPILGPATEAAIAELAAARRERYGRIWRAIMLAHDLETCIALLNGEHVPDNRLDPDWVRRFGRRKP